MQKFVRLDTAVCVGVAVMSAWATGYHPYSFYMLLRWFNCIMAGYLAWRLFYSERVPLALLFGIVAIIFNPIAPIRFQRDTWATLDLVGAAFFLFGAYMTSTFPDLKAGKGK